MRNPLPRRRGDGHRRHAPERLPAMRRPYRHSIRHPLEREVESSWPY